VLKKRRSTSQYLDALTKPMLPPVSLDLRHQRRNVLAAPRCQQTSLAGNHFRGNSVISSWRLELARGLRQASLVQVRCQFRDNNFITPHPQLYTLSVGCTVSTRQAEQKHYVRIHVSPRASDQSGVATTGGIRGPLPIRNPLRPNKLWQAKARRAWAGYALLRRTFVNGASR